MKLFSPINVGPLTLRNRIVMPAMHMNFTPDGFANDTLVEFYRLRAKGGVGLIIVGGCPIDPEAGAEFMIGLNHDKFIDGLKKLTAAIHEEGAYCGTQLYHAGRYTYSFFTGGKPAPSASATMSPLTREMSREMTIDEIKQTVQHFADAARRAKEAGFDIVEVICSAGYLVNQFLSPLTNQRTDEYGGSFENRARFGLEVVQAVMKEVGPDFPVGVRLAGNDFVPDSNTNKENARFAAMLSEIGVAMYNVTGGWHESRIPQITGALPNAGYAYLARNIKRQVKTPVAAANRITTPELAERLISEGWCDMISLGRSLISDPYWPQKAERGESDAIIHCIACNQGCLDKVFELKQVSCMVNPRAGHEANPVTPAATAKKVLVVGGGPGGLSAAITAAERGHQVTLMEKREQLGGQILACLTIPDKEEWAGMIPGLAHQAESMGVKILLNKEATPAEIEAFSPDVLIIATGAKPIHLTIPGLPEDRVVSAIDVLENRASLGDQVAIIGGGPIGVETALMVAHMGTISSDTAAFLLKHNAEDPAIIRDMLWHGTKKVTIVEMLSKVGNGIGKSTKWVAIKEIGETGVETITDAKAIGYENNELILETQNGEQRLKADTVVLAAGMSSYNPLEDFAKDFSGTTITVGDAVSVRDAFNAIQQGYHLCREL